MIGSGAKLGIHAEATPAGIVSVLESAAALGVPVPWYKSVNNGTSLQKVREVSPTTKTMFRIAHDLEGVPGLADLHPSDTQEIAVRAGQLAGPIIAWAESNPGWQAYVDCIEIANEPKPAPENPDGWLVLGLIMKETVKILRYRYPGTLWGVMSTNNGTPEYDEMKQVISSGLFEEPDIILCHHTGIFGNWTIDEGYGELIPGATEVPFNGGALVGRTAYLHQLLGDERMPQVVITEMYYEGYDDLDVAASRMEWVDNWAKELWWLECVMPFTYRMSGWPNHDYSTLYRYRFVPYLEKVSGRVNAIKPPIGPPDPPEEVIPDGLPREQYKRTYILLHPSESREVAQAVLMSSWDNGPYTVGPSADDAGVGALRNKTAVIVNPQRWVNDPDILLTWFGEHYEGTVVKYAYAETTRDVRVTCDPLLKSLRGRIQQGSMDSEED